MSEATKRSSLGLVLALVFASAAFLSFIALGTWQVKRLAWKLDLIERVNQRVNAAPVVPPAKAQWASVGINDEYTHVCVSGEYRHDHETYVQAVTVRGPGDWVLTPLQSADGTVVLINRGFVTAEQKSPTSRDKAQVAGVVKVCGLLRLTEPSGGFLRRNDPTQARWFSRDVVAIAATQYLPMQNVAPYFIDADAAANPGGVPLGGLTVVRFHNSHLVYAITWYGLALLTLVAGVVVVRYGRR
ncbi:SURF1 family protein [Stenotrophobium rhamnosiphilum]|uniref:SURF1-like protein n=1 Tax=Stenotrophobium rhamnosiphilum TaxID=2029166 RepID=A0A2T5MC99_9GAMM|nr:SURF1 family protein [Stenotrophobium rhamnosiphilum]PTU30190.1 hypothetical protein CJD38_16750 [Stenotrophobium rhamnosiphilum]